MCPIGAHPFAQTTNNLYRNSQRTASSQIPPNSKKTNLAVNFGRVGYSPYSSDHLLTRVSKN
jgi:hypothetical protein